MSSARAPAGRDIEAPFERLIAALLLALLATGAVVSALVHSGVPDEVAVHVPSGFLFLETGVFSGGLANPPLGQLLVALPAWLAASSGVGDYVPFEATALLGPRSVVVASGVLGAFVAWRFARGLYAPTVALAALFFLATSPNWLAHASLATLDVPIATAIVFVMWLARRAVARASWDRFALLGVGLGIACSIKVQGLAAIGLVALQLLLAKERERSWGGHLRIVAPGFALSLSAAWCVVHASYGFAPLAAGEWLPADFVEASVRKLVHGSTGHTSYLLGELSTSGWWYYFPVALAVKTPVALLVCAAIGLVTLALASSRQRFGAFGSLVWVLLPLATFFGLALASSVNIGIRHLLPFLPFFCIVGAVGLVRLGEVSRPALLALCLVQLFEAAVNAPHGLRYFNVFGGGSTGGYRVLLDSNFDWGQHDEQLRAYLAEAGHGSDADAQPVEIAPDALAPQPGRIIVGASALHGILGPPGAWAWLRQHEPHARIAETWFEYRLAQVDIAAAPRVLAPRSLVARDELVRHVLAAAREAKSEREVRADLAVASACWELFEYACALDRARAVLRAAPDHRPAFWLASELTARRRLGTLRFEGRELLDGFESLEPAAAMLEIERLEARVSRLEPLGIRPTIVALHETLGDLHFAHGEWTPALANWRRAHALDGAAFAVLYKLGWLLATHPEASQRDAELALHLAREHGERTGWRVAAAHDLLGVALANSGRFAEAGAAAARALEIVDSEAGRAAIEARRAGYEVGRPHRQPVASETGEGGEQRAR